MGLPILLPWAVFVWRVILGIGLAFELWNAFDNEAGDTLSELVVVRMAQFPWFHGAITGLLLWLLIHWQALGDPSRGMALIGAPWIVGFMAVSVAVVYALHAVGVLNG